VAGTAASAVTTPPAPAPRTTGGWTVEANPTRSRQEAEELQLRLRSRGYDSTLVHVLRDGETWYRLHVGRYGSPEQASEVVRKLRDGEGVAHAFVATE
jgi:cell division protein FtsN